MDTLCITHVLNALLTISSHTFENGPFKKKKKRQAIKNTNTTFSRVTCTGMWYSPWYFFPLTYSHTSWDCVKTGPAYSWQTVKSRIERLQSGVKFFK